MSVLRNDGSLSLPVALGLCCVSALALLLAVASLDAEMAVDTPLLHYWAWLVNEQGRVPYRDAFETSMPMSLWVHQFIGAVLGYDDIHVRIADLGLLAVFIWMSQRWLRPFGVAVAWGASAVFALAYLSHGADLSLQRDYLALVPVVGALALLGPQPGAGRLLGVGVLLALSALIKPHMVLALVPIAFYLWQQRTGQTVDFAVRKLGWIAAGLALPVMLCVLWLGVQGALGPFLDMGFSYLPLHNALNGDIEVLEGSARASYLWSNFIHLGGYARWVGPALFGVFFYLGLCSPSRETRTRAQLLLGLIAVFAVYPVIAGKFWRYHYTPLLYFLIAGTGLLLADASARRDAGAPLWLPRLVFFLAIIIGMRHLYLLPGVAIDVISGRTQAQPALNGRVQALADWLQAEVRPGETIQVLDWGGGVLHAMLRARQPVATRFLYDYHFYHHVESPAIVALRADFMSELQSAPPDLIVINTRNQGIRPKGVGTSGQFDALDTWLAAHYRLEARLRGYRILRRIP